MLYGGVFEGDGERFGPEGGEGGVLVEVVVGVRGEVEDVEWCGVGLAGLVEMLDETGGNLWGERVVQVEDAGGGG